MGCLEVNTRLLILLAILLVLIVEVKNAYYLCLGFLVVETTFVSSVFVGLGFVVHTCHIAQLF